MYENIIIIQNKLEQYLIINKFKLNDYHYIEKNKEKLIIHTLMGDNHVMSKKGIEKFLWKLSITKKQKQKN